ncbi:hypothetical protein T4B_3662 [Trichinella pseudospiralis]|uniref:Uncharacterized protein n=1 Tax=Trichinella pseudospiralis TaxID=6337 RepID=A0A0V1IR48_TRIPS|nr:hypothetical protein T4B_3662 [Trichinella pseudospiralis]
MNKQNYRFFSLDNLMVKLVVTQAFGLCQPVREIKLPCRHDRHPFIHSFIHSFILPSIHPSICPAVQSHVARISTERQRKLVWKQLITTVIL